MKIENHKFQTLKIIRFLGWITFAAILLIILVSVIGAGELFLYANTPKGLMQPHPVTISKGDAFYQIAIRLEKAHLIDNRHYFGLLARLLNADKCIHSGNYSLSPDMSPYYILNQLTSGNVELIRIVFPEGYTIELMAEVLASANIVSRHAFIDHATDPGITRFYGIEADNLEGYLFPDTYYFAKHSSAKQVVETMLKQFWTVFDKKLCQRAQEIGFSIHDTITFASIVEKETGQAHERPKIASVFHNRLKRNMRLESDPTVIYGIPDFDGNLTRKHLKNKTPYNTYRIKGLPKGPIANPGKAAIIATLYPESTNYLYFVSKQDGTHHFSTNLKAHNRAVDLYQRKRRSNQSNNG